MPIRLLKSGDLEFDSPLEALQYQRLAEEMDDAEPPKTKAVSLGSTREQRNLPLQSQGFSGFFNGLQPHQKKLLSLLPASPENITTENLAKAAGVETGQIGPMFRHIRDRAKTFGLIPEKLIISATKKFAIGERPMRIFATKYYDEIQEQLN